MDWTTETLGARLDELAREIAENLRSARAADAAEKIVAAVKGAN